VTTPVGYARLEAEQLNWPGRRFLLIEGPCPNPQRTKRPGVRVVSVFDPGHAQLRKAWEDLAYGY